MPARLTPPVNEQDHIAGSPTATVELVEYGDYQCPHCGAAHPVVNRIRQHFGERLKFAFRNFPLSNIHEMALPAAMSAEAAAKQDKFWQMHDIIFDRQDELSEEALVEFAVDAGLDIDTFRKDIQDASLAEKIDGDFESGVRSGVNGTPSFFINGHKYEGGYDYGSLVEALGG